jgi:hypothetical protein
MAFTTAHPEIFAWLNLHTFGGCFIRPPGHHPDNKMNQGDFAVFRQIGQWAEEITGYPMVSGYEEFTYTPETPIKGDLTDYAYQARGCIAYVCELWDLFHRIGASRKKPYVDHYTHLTRSELVALGKWAQEHAPEVLKPWRTFEHPQIGHVEIGGVDVRFGINNPPVSELAEICRAQSAMFLRVAAMCPRLVLEDVHVEALAGGVWEVRGAVRNTGYLATYGLPSSKDRHWNEPLVLEVRGEGGALVSEDRLQLGHVDGWGKGRFQGGALYYLRSDHNATRKAFRFTVRGAGRVYLRAGSSRVGWIASEIRLAPS